MRWGRGVIGGSDLVYSRGMKTHFEQTLTSEKFGIKVIEEVVGGEAIHHTAINSNSPIDFELNGLSFDVKYANPSMVSSHKTLPLWDFDLKHLKEYCDYMVLIGMKNFAPVRVFLVPNDRRAKRHIRVSIDGSSKWNEYVVWSRS
jgi:hypothetical protein